MNNDILSKELLAELHIENLPQEDQEKIVVELGENIMHQVILDIYDLLPGDKQDEFKTLAVEGDLEKMTEFVSPFVGDPNQIIESASRKVVNEFKTLISES